jgi:transposase
MCRRGEYVERSFAHLYDTGRTRRTHLRGHRNVLKWLLIHAGAFNLGLVVRSLSGPARLGLLPVKWVLNIPTS